MYNNKNELIVSNTLLEIGVQKPMGIEKLGLPPQDITTKSLFEAIGEMRIVRETAETKPVRELESRMKVLCSTWGTKTSEGVWVIDPSLELQEDGLDVKYGMCMQDLNNGDVQVLLTMRPKESEKIDPVMAIVNSRVRSDVISDLNFERSLSDAALIVSAFEDMYKAKRDEAERLRAERRANHIRLAKAISGVAAGVTVIGAPVAWLTQRDTDAVFDAKGYSLTDVNSGKANEVIVPKYSLDLVTGKPVKVDDIPEVGAVVVGRDLKFRVDDGPRIINIVVSSEETPVNGQQYCEKAEIVGPIPEDSTLHAATYYPTFETEVRTAEKPLSNATVVFEPEKRIVKACVNEFYPGTSKFAVVFDLVNGK
jgi:hypothetical protein